MDRSGQLGFEFGLGIHFIVFAYWWQLNCLTRCLSMKSRSSQAERQSNKQSRQTGPA